MTDNGSKGCASSVGLLLVVPSAPTLTFSPRLTPPHTRTPDHARGPATLGYRWPAEWEPHAATWLSWPHNRATWPAQLERVEASLAMMVRALAPHEAVRINVQSDAHAAHVQRILKDAGAWHPAVRLHRLPTDDAWIRDYGPLFVTREEAETPLAATAWRFNSWGRKYPPWRRDASAAVRMAAVLDVPAFESDLVLEGGALDTNGASLLLASRSSFLDPRRNPGCTLEDVEIWLRCFLGAQAVVWLDVQLAGDDTDGHVDTFARFAAEATVLLATEDNPADANFAPLREARAQLQAVRLPDGRPLRLVPLPMPAPLVQHRQRLPASYANFYIANGVILCPAYGDPADAEARRVLAGCFPHRAVVPVPCADMVWGLGALHCLTQHVPATSSRTARRG